MEKGEGMIIDKIENALKYLGIDPYLDMALRDIAADTHSAVISEGMVTRGEADYETVPENDFETHLVKTDIHILTEGEEKILYAPSETLTEVSRDEANDCFISRGEAMLSYVLRPGYFMLLFPMEAHAVHLAAGEPQKVHKIVYKITVKK